MPRDTPGSVRGEGTSTSSLVSDKWLVILTKSLRVDWDLTVSMSVFTARQIHHATP